MPFILATLILIIDQATKILCASLLPQLPHASFTVWDGVFNLTYAENSGAAFGMLSGVPWLLHIITVVLVGFMVYVLVSRYKKMPRLMRYALCVILAGALGNLIDRIFLGYVRDMFDFCLINFYIFNVADAAITLGAIALGVDILFFKSGREFLQNELSDKDDKKTLKNDMEEKDETNTETGNNISVTGKHVQREK